MKTPSGEEIPDPPGDPKELAKWKTRYYLKLHGQPPGLITETLRQQLEQRRDRIFGEAVVTAIYAAKETLLIELIDEVQEKLGVFDYSWDTQDVVEWLKNKLELLQSNGPQLDNKGSGD